MNRLKYSFYMVQAYLASMMGDDEMTEVMLSIANDFHRKWLTDKVNAEHWTRPI